MLTIIIISFVSYLVLALWLWRGWAMLSRFEIAGASVSLSVVVYMRNKASNIRYLLSDIASQHYLQELIQVVVVDDHSTDRSAAEVENFAKEHSNVELLRLPKGKCGKKAALRLALSHFTGELVVTTDADTRATPRWLATIAAFYANYYPSMIICPVMFTPDRSFLGRWQALKQIKRMGVAAATAAWRRPMICNGLNLAIDRKVMEQHASVFEHHSASGEDIAMMLEIKKNPLNRIFYLKSTGAVISTAPSSGLKNKIDSRIRRIFQCGAYINFGMIAIALIVFIANLSVLTCLVAGFFQFRFLWIGVILIMAKILVDGLFLNSLCRFWKVKLFGHEK